MGNLAGGKEVIPFTRDELNEVLLALEESSYYDPDHDRVSKVKEMIMEKMNEQ